MKNLQMHFQRSIHSNSNHLKFQPLWIESLTRSKNEPNVKQNTSGPAKSVSCNIVWSVVRNGFNTDNVWKWIIWLVSYRFSLKILHSKRRWLTFCKIWFGLMPSSEKNEKQILLNRVDFNNKYQIELKLPSKSGGSLSKSLVEPS